MIDNANVREGLKKYFQTPDVVSGKGGFFVRGQGFISLARARKLTGIEAKPREHQPRQQPWGDYATIAMLNQPRIK